MNSRLAQINDKLNALSLRERILLFITLSVLLIYLCWMFWISPVRAKTSDLQRQNRSLQQKVTTLTATSRQLQQRIRQGVHQQAAFKLRQLRQELARVRKILQQQTSALIEPNEMFALMQQMIFAESNLTLTRIKRKQVQALFKMTDKDTATADQQHAPVVYRHVMQIGFDGRYRDVLNYTRKLEGLQWKLIWDRIDVHSLKYPRVHVDIEISTLSDKKSWVGL